MQASYGNCLARKYLFGLWKGAQNPPEFFIRYSPGAVMDLKELRGPTYVISQILHFRFSLFIRKTYVKRKRGKMDDKFLPPLYFAPKKGEMTTMMVLTRALLGYSAEHSQALLDMRFCTPNLGRAVFLPR